MFLPKGGRSRVGYGLSTSSSTGIRPQLDKNNAGSMWLPLGALLTLLINVQVGGGANGALPTPPMDGGTAQPVSSWTVVVVEELRQNVRGSGRGSGSGTAYRLRLVRYLCGRGSRKQQQVMWVRCWLLQCDHLVELHAPRVQAAIAA